MRERPTVREMSGVSAQDVVNYLLSHEWRETPAKNKKIRRFLGPSSDSGTALSLSVPAEESLSDFYERVQDLLFTLAAIEKDTPEGVLGRISLASRDIMRMRVLSRLSDSQTLPLDIAAIEVDGLRELYMWAACSEQKAAPYFDKPTSISEGYVRNCRFGHTFEGSFGFTVTSPIIEKFEQLNLFTQSPESPFERRVTERIGRSFALIAESVQKEDPSIVVESYAVGLNSRMCDALVKMSLEKQNDLAFGIEWSPQLHAPPVSETLSTIHFGVAEFELVEYASQELQKVEPFNEFIIGKIVTLHSISDPLSETDLLRTAIVKHEYEGRSIDVRLELTRDQYIVAYNAHGQGQRVSVQGNLYRKGTVWRMTDISEIKPF